MANQNSRALRAESPAYDAQAVTPDDDNDLAAPCRALYIGGAGDVKVTTLKGTTLTLAGVSGVLPLGVQRVHSTGTTATNIVALY